MNPVAADSYRTAIIDKIEAGTHVLVPVKANGQVMLAIEDYYASRMKYADGRKQEAMKADCWMTLMAYYAVIEAAQRGEL